MILPPILSIDTSKTDEVVLDLEISAGLEAFGGHFPDQPILPGVVQIDWALRFANLYLNVMEQAARDFQVKFRSVIVPGKPLFLILHIDRSKKKLSFEYKSDQNIMSSGQMRLGAVA